MRDVLLALFLFSAFPMILYRYEVGALVIGFMSFMYPQNNMYGFALSIEWIDYFFMATIGSYILNQGFKNYKHTRIMTFVLVFFTWASLTTFFAIDPDVAYFPWEKFAKIIILAYMVFAMLNSESRIKTFLKVMVLSIGFYGVKGGVFTVITGGAYRVLGPMNSFYSDNNRMALALVMTIPFMLFFIFHSKNIYQKYFAIFCSILSAISVLGTQSRTGYAALVISFFYYTFLRKTFFKSMIFVTPIALIAIFVMADTWRERIATTSNLEEDGSFQGRVEMWEASVKIANDYPIIGGGFDVIYLDEVIQEYIAFGTEARAIHSAYFQMLAEHGYIGLLLFLSFLAILFSKARLISRESKNYPQLSWMPDLSIAIRSSLVGYMVIGLTSNIAFFDILYFNAAVLGVAVLILENHIKARQKISI